MTNQATTSTNKQRWDVEIDLTQRSHGAIRFARWIRERSKAPEELRGVYVGSEPTIRRIHPGVGSVSERAKRMAQASAEGVGAAEAFTSFEVITDEPPEHALCRLTADNSKGLIVGRASGIDGWSLLSLGRVTRRLLRSLPCPVVVVPRDLKVDQLGRGPIVVGVQPDRTSVAAARFAVEMGTRLGLDVVFVHVVEPTPGGVPEALSGVLDLDERVRSATLAVKKWAQEHDLAAIERRIAVGMDSVALMEAAEKARATMIVSGSRHLSLAARLFRSSMGSELASHANRPVVVVPSADQPQRRP